MTSPITLGRQAAWNAILNWSGLQRNGVPIFKRQDRFEADHPSREQIEAGYGPGDLPAIAIRTSNITMKAEVTRTHHWMMDLAISVWTPDWNLLTAELIAPQIVNALYANTPTGVTVTFMETATGYHPDSIPGVSFAFSGVGKDAKILAIRTDIVCRLRLQFSPYEQ